MFRSVGNTYENSGQLVGEVGHSVPSSRTAANRSILSECPASLDTFDLNRSIVNSSPFAGGFISRKI